MSINLVNLFLSILPVLILFILLVFFKLNSHLSALFALLPAIFLATFQFKVEYVDLLNALGRGAVMSLFIIMIISGAIFLFNVVDKSGGFAEIKNFFLGCQECAGFWLLLFLSWVVAPFIQGVSGFGVPVAVVGALLVGLGYKPNLALATVLIGHSWSVTFGSMGSAFFALQLVTGLPLIPLGLVSVALTFVTILTTGLGVAWIYGGRLQVKKAWIKILILSFFMFATQLLLVYINLPHLATFGAGLFGSIFCLIFWRDEIIPNKSTLNLNNKENIAKNLAEQNNNQDKIDEKLMHSHVFKLLIALSPYLILLLLVLLFQISPVRDLLSGAEISFGFPGFTTGLDFQVQAEENYIRISLINHPFFVLFISGLLGGLFQQLRNKVDFSDWLTILILTVKQLKQSGISIFLLLLLSGVMNYSGMIQIFARGLAAVSGFSFPILSPFVGILGAFLTGSNTSSNVLFGSLQYEIAEILEITPLLLVASHTVGSSLGSAVAPTKIILGIAACGCNQEGQEGYLLRRCLSYALLSALMVGIIAMIISLVS